MHSSPISRNRGATIQTRKRNSVQSVRRSISIDLSVIKANFNGAESRVEIVGRSRDIDSDESAKHQSLFGSEPNSIRLINSSTTDRHRCEAMVKRSRPDPIRSDPFRFETYLCTISCCIHSLTLMWVSMVDPELCLDNFDRLPKFELLSYALSFFITSFRSGLLSLL